MSRSARLLVAAIVLVALLAVSGHAPYDRTTWLLEVFPVIVALPAGGLRPVPVVTQAQGRTNT